MRRFACLVALLLTSRAGFAQEGHSHNDYNQPAPFSAAAQSGMLSIEADVFWVNGELLVGHSRDQLKSSRNLTSMYLQPLRDWQGRPLELLVDIKSEPDEVVSGLNSLLQQHSWPTLAAVVLSGSRPTKPVSSYKFLTVEGTVAELRAHHLPPNCHYVAGNWTEWLHWRGQGVPSPEERAELSGLVKLAHSQGVKLRLWGGPDGELSWEEQWRAGVDRINTDQPEKLGAWLSKRRSLSH